MEAGQSQVVGFIPVRGGSKGIPGKNIKPMAGNPLVYWVVRACAESPAMAHVYVSTDDDAIRGVVEGFSFDAVTVVARGAETASDQASTESAMLEFAREHDGFEHIALIQATSPLLTSEDVTGAVQQYVRTGADSLLTVCRTHRFLWQEHEGIVTPSNYDPARRPRRQDWPGQLVENGALYLTSRQALLASQCRLSGKVAAYEMSPESYYEIDEPSDWAIIESLLLRRQRSVRPGPITDVKLLCVDVDGTLTDGGMYYSEQGELLKRFDTRDAKGLARVREQGIQVAIVTSENTPIVAARARKLGIEHVLLGVDDKVEAVGRLLHSLALDWEQLGFLGDDINDREVMIRAAFSACPADAPLAGSGIPSYVATRDGGHGAVREVCELLLTSLSD